MKRIVVSVLLLILVAIGAWYLLNHRSTTTTSTGTGAATTTQATFYCANSRTIGATFTERLVDLALSDGRKLSLPQAISGSGARYEATSTGSNIVFWNKGDNAYLTENGQTTFGQCTAAIIAESDAPGYLTYTDRGRTFSFAFPSDDVVTGTDPGFGTGWSIEATSTGQVLARINVPRDAQPGTNFVEAWFTVGASADPDAVRTCEQNPSGPTSTTMAAMIGGVRFVGYSFTGAGAGNFYDTTSYRTVRDNQCYALEYTIHSGNIYNYPQGTVKPFDNASVRASLDEMARSFTFLK